MAGDDEDRDQESSGTEQDAAPPSEDDNPIVVTNQGGAYVRLPVPHDVVERLGGPAALTARLHPTLMAESAFSRHGPAVINALTVQYNELFQNLQAIVDETESVTAEAKVQRGDQEPATPPDPDPSNPIHVDPGGGLLITVEVPGDIVKELGGPYLFTGRLKSVLRAESLRTGDLSPGAAASLTARYDELFGHLEAIASQEQSG